MIPHPFIALATALTGVGAAVEVTALQQTDPTTSRFGYLIILISLPLWIAGEVRRALACRARQIADAHVTGYQMCLADLAEAAERGELPEPPGTMTIVEEEERHDR